jgi:hypothetical protein
MNRALAIRTIQLLGKLPAFHVASYSLCDAERSDHREETKKHLAECRIVIDDAMALMQELRNACVTSAESTPAKTAPSPSSDTASSTPTST